ncbi:MAG: hypothetical protein ACR2PR_09250 [Pseudohongiellaceae bacterium]
MTKQKQGGHNPDELQKIATQKGGIAPPGKEVGKIVGLNIAPISFRGLTPIFWMPPEVRDWPCFPIGGETPAEIVKPGIVGLIDERHKRLVIFRTLPKGAVSDRSSVPDILARLTGISKSDMMPQGIFHDTGYRHGLRDFAWELGYNQFPRIDPKTTNLSPKKIESALLDYARRILEEMATGMPKGCYSTRNKSSQQTTFEGRLDDWIAKGMIRSFNPDQEWCDDLLRVLLLNFNAGVLPSRRRIAAWLAVRAKGDESFRDAKMKKTCEKIAVQIANYCKRMERGAGK